MLAKTKDEVETSFPALFLDIGLDGVILYDSDFFEGKARRVREIIKEAGLKRTKERGDFVWVWDKPPRGGWEITWEGYREL